MAEAVKSRASPQRLRLQSRRRKVALRVLVGVLAARLWVTPGFAQAKSAAVEPSSSTTRSEQCSLRRPVCVTGPSPDLRQTALRLLEEAFELLVLGQQGPTWSLDPHAEPMTWTLEPAPLRFEVERTFSPGFDRGRVRCAGGSVTRGSAIACVSASSMSRLAPSTSQALTQGMAGYLALVHDGGETVALAGERASREPEQGVLSDPAAPTAAILFEHIARKARAGQATAAPWLALVLPATTTPAGSPRFLAEPDLFDTLRSTLATGDPHLARFFDEMAVRRFSEPGLLGSTGRMPELAWDVDATSLPRNLVLPRPLLPSGSAYVVVRLDDRTRQNGLALRTFCEDGSRYAWSMARLDASDRIVTRVQATGRESGTNAEGILRELDSVPKALIVGTSLGGGPGRELDPDETPFGAHSCEVALDRLPAP